MSAWPPSSDDVGLFFLSDDDMFRVIQFRGRDGGGEEVDRHRKQASGDGRCCVCCQRLPGSLQHVVSNKEISILSFGEMSHPFTTLPAI